MIKQNYKKLEFTTKETFSLKDHKIETNKLNNYRNVYISNNCHIKPKGVQFIIKNVNEALKEYKINDDTLKIVIVSFDDGIGGFGSYNAIKNEVYFNEIISDKNKLIFENIKLGHVERHEIWHLKQAIDYKNKYVLITYDNYENYLIYARSNTKKFLDSLRISEDNVGVISKYAYSMYIYKHYDEVEAEIKAKKGALCTLQNFQKKYKN